MTEMSERIARQHRRALCGFALLLMLLGPSPVRSRQLQTQQVTIAGKARIISITLEGKRHFKNIILDLDDGRAQLVEAKAGVCRTLRSGMRVQATGSWVAASAAARAATGTPRFLVTSVTASGGLQGKPIVTAGSSGSDMVAAASTATMGGQPFRPALVANYLAQRDLSTIIIPFAAIGADGKACPSTQLPQVPVSQVKQAIFQEANRDGITVGSLYNQCSYGKTRLTSLNSLVAPLVKLPCNGTTNDVAWTFSKCDFDDFNGYADAADEALRAQGVVLERYKYRVYLVPPSTCGFVGLGYIGCDGSYTCRAWIGAGFWASPAAIAHELGHNLFLNHANSINTEGVIEEYGDMTGIMGYCCDTRCPSPTQAWQLGWLTMQQLDSASLPPGQTVQLTLDSQAVNPQSGLRINTTSWVAGVDPVFLALRTSERGDKGLASWYSGQVHVYQSPVTSTYDPRPSLWHGGLNVGDSWTEPTAGLVVRHLGSSGDSAAISVCRIGGAETAASCAALRDNDCNGLVGNADPTCAFLAAAKARQVAAASRIRRKPSKVITNTALARPTTPAPKRRPSKSAR